MCHILYPSIYNEDLLDPKPFDYTKAKQITYTTSIEDETKELSLRKSFLDFFVEILNGYIHCLFFMDDKLPVFNKEQFFCDYSSKEDTNFLTFFFESQVRQSCKIDIRILHGSLPNQ